jgi:hypothetical protein
MDAFFDKKSHTCTGGNISSGSGRSPDGSPKKSGSPQKSTSPIRSPTKDNNILNTVDASPSKSISPIKTKPTPTSNGITSPCRTSDTINVAGTLRNDSGDEADELLLQGNDVMALTLQIRRVISVRMRSFLRETCSGVY